MMHVVQGFGSSPRFPEADEVVEGEQLGNEREYYNV
jgi:hypothetical protein